MKSKLKTWLRRNGFKGEGRPRKPMRECNGYVERSGRKFRVRSDIVDIGDDDFDRWANSTERTITIDEFMLEFAKGM